LAIKIKKDNIDLTKNWYWKWNAALDKTFCEYVIHEFDNKKSEQAKVSDTPVVDKKIRKTKTYWLNAYHPIGCVLQSYIRSANKDAGWNFDITHMEAVQLGKYHSNEKGFYGLHIDSSTKEEDTLRKLSVVALLSHPSDFEGGEFKMQGINESLLTTQGSIIVFPSYLWHEVLPVTRGVRYTATSWMHGPYFK
jgi:PKHD-type hydroxylase